MQRPRHPCLIIGSVHEESGDPCLKVSSLLVINNSRVTKDFTAEEMFFFNYETSTIEVFFWFLMIFNIGNSTCLSVVIWWPPKRHYGSSRIHIKTRVLFTWRAHTRFCVWGTLWSIFKQKLAQIIFKYSPYNFQVAGNKNVWQKLSFHLADILSLKMRVVLEIYLLYGPTYVLQDKCK